MKASPTYQKLRGGYYTPDAVALFLARWAIQSPTAAVLEPSCGDGSLLCAAVRALRERGAGDLDIAAQIQGVELDADEAGYAAQQLSIVGIPWHPEQIHVGDFFAYCRDRLFQDPFFRTGLTALREFDAIIGNPPFIRYQSFPEEYRLIAFSLMRQAGFSPNRLTNIWVPFLVLATLLLREHGRLAMVIPAELLQVNYAAETRAFLTRFYGRIALVTFRGLVFDGIQQEVVLFLGDRNGTGAHGIEILEVTDVDDLLSPDASALHDLELKPLSYGAEKWTQYFLDALEINLLRSIRENPRLIKTGDAMDVDVGIVTGDNDFFVLTEGDVAQHGLQPDVRPLVGHSKQLRGMQFSEQDWLLAAANREPAYLLWPPDASFDALPAALRDYIAQAEERGVHEGYKCRIRKPWYKVRSFWSPEAFFLRQVHAYPKMVLNGTSASCTDTLHRVRFKPGVQKERVVAAFMNSLTFAFAELTGRSYGGGVLTFEPSEAEILPLPFAGSEDIRLAELDTLVRRNDIEAALDITDEMVLVRGLGLSRDDVGMLRGIWAKLRDRRIHRNHGARLKKIKRMGVPMEAVAL